MVIAYLKQLKLRTENGFTHQRRVLAKRVNMSNLIDKSNNITKTVGEFFIIWFVSFCKLIDALTGILSLGIIYTSLGLWSAKQLARYRCKTKSF